MDPRALRESSSLGWPEGPCVRHRRRDQEARGQIPPERHKMAKVPRGGCRCAGARGQRRIHWRPCTHWACTMGPTPVASSDQERSILSMTCTLRLSIHSSLNDRVRISHETLFSLPRGPPAAFHTGCATVQQLSWKRRHHALRCAVCRVRCRLSSHAHAERFASCLQQMHAHLHRAAAHGASRL